MRVLVTGANGFIGSNIVAALLAAGHSVVCGVREIKKTAERFPQCEVLAVDFNRDVDVQTWLPRLKNVDAVINCVGVLRGTRAQSIENIHVRTPAALFMACVQQNTQRVIQISALGIAENQSSEYATTKCAGDEALLALPLNCVVLRASLVVAPGSYGGTSFFRGLAGLPSFIPVIGDGQQLMQPIAMEDLARTVIGFLYQKDLPKKIVDVVGPEAISIQDLLISWRAWLGFAKAKIVSIPLSLIRLASSVGEWLGKGPVNKTSYQMLLQPNTADYAKFRELIDFTPQTFQQMLSRHPSYVQDRWHARLYFLRPLLIFSIGLLWILSGLLPLFGDKQSTFHWMQQLGVPAAIQPAMLYCVAIFDIAVGFATWIRWRFVRIVQLQLFVIAGYTLLATFATPALWLDIYGPLLKNIPIFVAVMIMLVIEEQR